MEIDDIFLLINKAKTAAKAIIEQQYASFPEDKGVANDGVEIAFEVLGKVLKN